MVRFPELKVLAGQLYWILEVYGQVRTPQYQNHFQNTLELGTDRSRSTKMVI